MHGPVGSGRLIQNRGPAHEKFLLSPTGTTTRLLWRYGCVKSSLSMAVRNTKAQFRYQDALSMAGRLVWTH